jgi:hypothetical protein
MVVGNLLIDNIENFEAVLAYLYLAIGKCRDEERERNRNIQKLMKESAALC